MAPVKPRKMYEFTGFVFFIFSKLLLNTFYVLNIIYSPIIVITIFSSLLLGTFGALFQKKIKRLLAYSTVTSVGYFLTMFVSNNFILINSVYTYIFLYSFSLLTLFSIFLQLYLNKKKLYVENISLLSGYFYNNKFMSLLLLFIF